MTLSPPAEIEDGLSILPGVAILGVLRNLNYAPWYALAEFVDNAIQSAQRSYLELVRIEPSYKLEVDITYDQTGGGEIVIVDNAAGIRIGDFPRAFRAAEVPPDRTGLSEFGMGMKSASIWFAKRWKVVTTSIGDTNEYEVSFDMRAVLAENMDRIEVVRRPASRDTHYTRVELKDLNQALPGRTLGKVRDHLREMYREFLRKGSLTLRVHNELMQYKDPGVLVATDYRLPAGPETASPAVQWRKKVAFELSSGLQVRGWAALRADFKVHGNGLSLFRRGRLIVGTTETPYRPRSIFTKDSSFKSGRLFGELHIDQLTVSHTKDGFQWGGQEEEFERELRRALDSEPLPLLKQAENYRAKNSSRSDIHRVREATDRTAEASVIALPETIAQLVDGSVKPAAVQSTSSSVHTRYFSFDVAGRTWRITIDARDMPQSDQWLVRSAEVDSASSDVEATVTLNIAHALFREFAMSSSDSLEALFRVGVAITVSEKLLEEVGDGAIASRFVRGINDLLGGSLSQRGITP